MIFAKDMQAMTAFYRDVIGMQEAPGGSADWQVLTSDGAELALHAIPKDVAAKIEIAEPPRPRHDVPVKVCFRASDPKAVREELLAKGVQMFESSGFGDLVLCDGTDPEGNMIQFSNR